MTVIRPNSISGITSLTAHRGSIDFYAHDGSAATFTNINSNVTSGVSTFASLNITGDLDVGGALTYEDVTNVDSIGVVTARNGIDVTGGTVTITTGANSASPAGSGDNLVIKDSNGCGLSILSGNGNSQNIYLGSVSDNDAVRLEGFYNSGSPYFNIYTGGTERLRVTSDGQVQVSNTASGNDAAVNIYKASGANSDKAILRVGYDAAAAFEIYRIRNIGDIFMGPNQSGSDLIFQNVPTGGSTTERLRITSDGYLGINHTSPGTRLVVKQNNGVAYNGNVQSVSYNAAAFINETGHTSGGTYTGFQFNITGDSQNRICSMGMITEASNSRASSLVFHTDDGGNRTEKLRITSAGNVAIGHNSAPTKLGIRGTSASTDATVQIVGNGVSTLLLGQDAAGGVIRGQGGSNQLKFKVGGSGDDAAATGGVEALRITSAGDVVIGTTAAARGPLHIHKDSADCYLHVTNSTTGTGSGDGFTIHQSGVETLLNNRESGNMRLYTNGGEKVRITSSGRVLVGKSISQATSTIENCDVDFHCTGPLSVGSNSNANQAQMQRVGRRVINLYNTTYSSSGGNTLHLETSLWGGGSPHGNSEFIMGGFHIHGYRYSSAGICEEIIYFHQWNGSLANYSRHQYGNWNAGSSCYVGSNGNVYIKLPNTAYYGFAIDFIQHPWYDARDCTILNATFNSGTNL